MKKLLLLVLIGGAFIAFTSCKKACTCKEKYSNYTHEYSKDDLSGYSCADMQNALNQLSQELGLTQSWSCK